MEFTFSLLHFLFSFLFKCLFQSGLFGLGSAVQTTKQDSSSSFYVNLLLTIEVRLSENIQNSYKCNTEFLFILREKFHSVWNILLKENFLNEWRTLMCSSINSSAENLEVFLHFNLK